ncbi:MAG: electron transfer flavoprotein subunit alpha/FixB family protein [Desulfobacteraceae bacterium]|jgi:electron transfer flavoprotein alpha subunit
MTVLVIAEQVDGVFRKVTFEALSAAAQLGGDIAAAALGSGIESAAGELATYGAARTLVADDPALAEYTVDAYTNVLAEIIGQLTPDVIIIGASTQGKELAARLSARLDAALATDCLDLKMDGGQVVVTRPMYGGKVLADVTLAGAPAIVALRPNIISAVEAPVDGAVETVAANVGDVKTEVKSKQLETGKVDLTEAEIVVSGGRGMGGDDYSTVEALAEALGAAVGASRSAVDEGWRPASDQVGQTGKTVSPNLYVACGISGAIQHLAGMSSSKVIVAINKDSEAPIFTKADYGIVGDLFEVLPALTEAVKKIKA